MHEIGREPHDEYIRLRNQREEQGLPVDHAAMVECSRWTLDELRRIFEEAFHAGALDNKPGKGQIAQKAKREAKKGRKGGRPRIAVDEAWILRAAHEGMSLRKIAEAQRVSYLVVRRVVRKEGGKPTLRAWLTAMAAYLDKMPEELVHALADLQVKYPDVPHGRDFSDEGEGVES